LARSKEFVVSTRTKRWGGASVNTRIAARVNKEGEIVEVKASQFDAIKINKEKLVNLQVGHEYKFHYGGRIVRNSKNLITIISENGDLVQAYTFDMGHHGRKIKVPFILNVFMKVGDRQEYKGLCAEKNEHLKSHDFTKEFHPHHDKVPPTPCHGHLRRVIVRKCDRKFKNKHRRNGCIVDLCSNIPMGIEKKKLKMKEKE